MAYISTSMVVMILEILTIVSTSSTKATKVSHSLEGEALLRWRDSFPYYYGLSSWNTTNPCDNWAGVTCNGVGRVTGIDLSDYYYYTEGTLNSFNFSSFPFLSTLTLSGGFYGQIPHEIGTLSQLTHLDLSSNSYNYNQLSGHHLPLSFANLTKLTHLDLSGNLFEGKVTLPFFSLTYLDLSYNKFSGKLPLSLSNLNNLTYLDLSGNLFEGKVTLPFSLTYLDLSYNKFSGKLPLSFSNLHNITYLDVSYNFFHGEVPLPPSHKLTHLDLSYNSFSGQLPPSLPICVKLETLQLQSNHFSGRIPPEYGYLNNMTEFRLDHNQISGPIPVEIMNLQSLSLLDLSKNKLTGSIPSMLYKSSNLRYLYLGTNQVTGPIPRTIGNLHQLVELELQDNNISGILPPEIGRLSYLTSLRLSNNSLHGRIPSQMGNLANLVELDISKNSLTGAVPHQLTNMGQLRNLNLSHNKLSDTFHCSVCRMANHVGSLGTIDLSSNNFKGTALRCTGALVNSPSSPCDYSIYCDECFSSTPEVPLKKTPKNHESVKVIVLSYILSTIFLALCILGIYYFHRKSKMKSAKQVEAEQLKDGNLLSLWNYDGKIAYEDIIRSTEDFDSKYCIGVGGYGSVYKAILPSGKVVALKKLHHCEAQGQAYEKSFRNEIKFLTTIRHRNIVKLYGFCSNRQCMFLIYEYMERGSLFSVLNDGTEAVELDWSKRVNIVKGISYALSYMHHDCNPAILHRDISSNNVLLSSELEACVSDFGTARLMQPDSSNQTLPVGTYGYIAPGNFLIPTFLVYPTFIDIF
ncbi:non-specific serine/threonine protein kinase [Ranunculus cassubicifolius]